MIFVVGGSYNNKLNFVLEKYKLKHEDVYNGEMDTPYKGERIVYNFHEIVKRMLREKKYNDEILQFVKTLLKREDLIIISDEVGYGIVPISKEDRYFREMNGRISCYIAKEAREVYRVMYGIGKKIKGE